MNIDEWPSIETDDRGWQLVARNKTYQSELIDNDQGKGI
jgi:hypothetical protein